MTPQFPFASAATPTATLLPSPVAGALFWVGVVACVVAQYFIIRAVWRAVPSVTGSPDVPSPHRGMEIAWAILPAVLIVAVFLGAWRVLHPVAPQAVSASMSLSASPSVFPLWSSPAERGAPLALPPRG